MFMSIDIILDFMFNVLCNLNKNITTKLMEHLMFHDEERLKKDVLNLLHRSNCQRSKPWRTRVHFEILASLLFGVNDLEEIEQVSTDSESVNLNLKMNWICFFKKLDH